MSSRHITDGLNGNRTGKLYLRSISRVWKLIWLKKIIVQIHCQGILRKHPFTFNIPQSNTLYNFTVTHLLLLALWPLLQLGLYLPDERDWHPLLELVHGSIQVEYFADLERREGAAHLTHTRHILLRLPCLQQMRRLYDGLERSLNGGLLQLKTKKLSSGEFKNYSPLRLHPNSSPSSTFRSGKGCVWFGSLWTNGTVLFWEAGCLNSRRTGSRRLV